ncbi:ribonuclease HII [Candidatus Blochmanniella floridana]|uniref:Ribonuclease HII n=1 Tax=Blochmanniella floridana TaxID=203907 RepID=RNH2_BLOFL|nr:RecName: Full=Ribonuclease HII; Short=RNase HII [Candidatus Blochmannia floridanus]CAD83356.1 ribonuclease HII [Candidatus Blochmannia floridanus]
MCTRKYFLSKKATIVAGVDEVGCGSLVGAVVASAVLMLYPDQEQLFSGLIDSKALSNKKRLRFCNYIQKYSLHWSIGMVNVTEIDQLNIFQARLLSIKRAICNLSMIPDLVLIDGKHAPSLNKNILYQCFVKGDSRIPVISAASIIAKVTRDQAMMMLHTQYPKYGFHRNKGYATVFHLKQLDLYGPTIYHRKTFAPVKYMLSMC